MTRKRVKRRTIPCSVSFEPSLWDKIEFKENRSQWINEACTEKLYRERTKEGRIKELKEKKRMLAKDMHEINTKIKDLEE